MASFNTSSTYYAVEGIGSNGRVDTRPNLGAAGTPGASKTPVGDQQPIVKGSASTVYSSRPGRMTNHAPFSDPYAALPQGNPSARAPYSGGSVRPAGTADMAASAGATAMHQRDHQRMAPGHHALTEPLRMNAYNRIQRQAAAGCPQCRGFIAGATTARNAMNVVDQQNVLDGKAETPAEQRLQRQLQARIRSAGDAAVRQLVQQRDETINAFISRQATARAQAELQVRSRWKAGSQRVRTGR